jgi:hypothetical protein
VKPRGEAGNRSPSCAWIVVPVRAPSTLISS